jgi:segregation and condensation protein B
MLKPQDGCDHLGQAPYGGSQPTQNICEPNPRSIVEAMLFVGRPDDGTFSARELAAAMRGVSPGEIDAAVSELNSIYDQDQSPYAIVGSPQGYRLALRGEFQRVRDKYLGKIREARLTPAALEVLSVVAYNQPIPAEAINQIRGRPSGAVLATLVRRRLVRQVAPQASGSPTNYVTTDRFLRLFNLESLAALPRSEDLEAA